MATATASDGKATPSISTASSDAPPAVNIRTSSVTSSDTSTINSLCTAAWNGDAAPFALEMSLNFVHFNGFVIPAKSAIRSALFVVHPPDETTGAAASTNTTATASGTAAPATAAATHRRRKGFTFKLIPLGDVIGLDESKVESVAVRPLFYAAAAGHRATVEALISAYKKGDYDTASSAPVWEAKPHPDRSDKFNLMTETQYDAAVIARSNGFDEIAALLEHPNSRSCTDSRGCGNDCTLM